MTTKEPEFNLEDAAKDYYYNLYPVCEGGLVAATRSRFTTIEGFKAGYRKGREIERQAVLEEVREDFNIVRAAYIKKCLSWNLTAEERADACIDAAGEMGDELNKILSRLGGEK